MKISFFDLSSILLMIFMASQVQASQVEKLFPATSSALKNQLSAAPRISTSQKNSPNLIKDPNITQFSLQKNSPWRSTWYIAATREELRQLKEKITHSYTPEQGATLTIPAGAESTSQGKACRAIFSQIINLPKSANALVCQLEFQACGVNAASSHVKPQISALLRPLDAQGKIIRRANRNNLRIIPATGQWKNYQLRVTFPPECQKIHLSLQRQGVGQVSFKQMALRLPEQDNGLRLKLLPHGYLDNCFHIASGLAGQPNFMIINRAKVDLNQAELELELPPGLKLEAVSTPAKFYYDSQQGIYRITQLNAQKLEESVVRTLLSCNWKPGKTGQARLCLRRNGQLLADSTFKLLCVTAKKAAQPQLFTSGIASAGFRFASTTALEKYQKLIRQSGINALRETFFIDANFIRKIKFPHLKIYQHSVIFCNGYRLGGGNKPQNCCFLDVNQRPVAPGGNPAICPEIVIANSPLYQKIVQKEIARLKKLQINGLMSNWEPYMYDFKGCFCPRCQAAFVKFSKIAPEKVKAAWPRQVLTKFHAQWSRFRSWQHGQLLRRVAKDFQRHGLEFCPMLSCTGLDGRPDHHSMLYQAKDYLNYLNHLNAWGPYQYFMADEPYNYFSGWLLAQACSSQHIREFIDKQPGLAANFQLWGAPHGIQGYKWITFPEALYFQMVLYLVNRWDGAFAYYFPDGYDQRYWNALARANEQIAAYESIVLKGRKCQHFQLEPLSRQPQVSDDLCAQYARYPEMKPELPLYRLYQFQKEGKFLAAVGNFWQNGDFLTRLKFTVPQATGRYRVTTGECPRVQLSAPSGQAWWSAAELARGILLPVGAWQFRFVCIESAVHGEESEVKVSFRELQQLFARRQEQIAQALAREKQHQGDSPADNLPQKIKQQGFEVQRRGKQLTICQGKLQWQLDLQKGFRLNSWKIGAQEQIFQGDGINTFLRVDGKNTVTINGKFRLTELEVRQGKLYVSAIRNLTARDHGKLAGLRLTNTFIFNEIPGHWELHTELHNVSEQPITCRYGQKFLWQALKSLQQKPELATLGQQPFVRKFKPQYWTLNQDPEISRNFSPENIVKIQSLQAVFPKFTMAFAPAKSFSGIILWDRGHQQLSTFEPARRTQMLEPNQKIDFQTIFKIR